MQRAFNTIPQDRIVLYVDYICVISKTFDEHLERLQAVFNYL